MKLKILPVIVFLLGVGALGAALYFREPLMQRMGQGKALGDATPEPGKPGEAVYTGLDEHIARIKKDSPDAVAESLRKVRDALKAGHQAGQRGVAVYLDRLTTELSKGQLGAFEESIRVLHELPEDQPAVKKWKQQGLLAVAHARLKEDDAGGAELDATDALTLDDSVAEGWVLKGDAQAKQGRKADAAQTWREGLTHAPKDKQLLSRTK